MEFDNFDYKVDCIVEINNDIIAGVLLLICSFLASFPTNMFQS